MGENYALPITQLMEITLPRGIQKDASMTEPFEGKFEFRGTQIPVLNLKKVFKLSGPAGATLLVIRSVKGVLGLLVDAVTEILDSDKQPAPIPKGTMDPAQNIYKGILMHREDIVLLLDEDGLLP